MSHGFIRMPTGEQARVGASLFRKNEDHPAEFAHKNPRSLIDAMKSHDLARASKVVAHPEFRGANEVHENEITALHVAAERGFAQVCGNLLLSPDFELANMQTTDGSTALHFAAMNGHLEVCKILLDTKVEKPKIIHPKSGKVVQKHSIVYCFQGVDLCDAFQGTPLHDAAFAGHADVCALLVGHRRSKNMVYIQNHMGKTPQEVATGKAKNLCAAIMKGANAA